MRSLRKQKNVTGVLTYEAANQPFKSWTRLDVFYLEILFPTHTFLFVSKET